MADHSLDPPTPRPLQLLHDYTLEFGLSSVWQAIDARRARRTHRDNWPDWCFCPMLDVADAVQEHAPDAEFRMSCVSELAAWRPTQGIYRFDADLRARLWRTPVEGDIPTARIQQRLPEWCVYIEIGQLALTPEGDIPYDHLYGAFALLDIEPQYEYTQLHFGLDYEHRLIPLAFNASGTLAASLAETETRYRDAMAELGQAWASRTPTTHRVAKIAKPLLSLLLHLCSDDADIWASDGSDRQPTRPTPKLTDKHRGKRKRGGKRKRIPRLHPPSAPTVWHVGTK